MGQTGASPIVTLSVLGIYFMVYVALGLAASDEVPELETETAPAQPLTEPTPPPGSQPEEEGGFCSWFLTGWSCDVVGGVGDFFIGIWVAISTWFSWLGDFFAAVWKFIMFFWGFWTFNVPDAPTWIRVPVGTLITGSLGWSIVSLIRGN